MRQRHRGPIVLLTTLGALFITTALLLYARSTRDRPPTTANRAVVSIGSKTFQLEIAADPTAQDRGLGGRDHIDNDGGMIFVFPEPQWHEFVMRDCAVPIDLLYLDHAGRIIALYAMLPDPPRTAEEPADGAMGDFAYASRLKTYPSGGPAQFAIELKGNSIAALNLREGDLVRLDTAALEKLVR
ncbi:MAG: DUF192 domain-containing protein [Phycisphaerales bacterium]|nr:DUF192 domain-containing protein [Phycisphaerales bacterium]